MKKIFSIFKNKKGETSGLSLAVKIAISCIVGALVLTFFYYILEDYYIDNAIKNQNNIYSNQEQTINVESTYGAELEFSTLPED